MTLLYVYRREDYIVTSVVEASNEDQVMDMLENIELPEGYEISDHPCFAMHY